MAMPRAAYHGPDDGTISAPGILSSLVFAPEIVLPALRALLASADAGAERRVQATGFNATAHAAPRQTSPASGCRKASLASTRA